MHCHTTLCAYCRIVVPLQGSLSMQDGADVSTFLSLKRKCRGASATGASPMSFASMLRLSLPYPALCAYCRIVVPLQGSLYVQDGADVSTFRMLFDKAKHGDGQPCIDPQLSPDGTMVAFVRAGELWAVAGELET